MTDSALAILVVDRFRSLAASPQTQKLGRLLLHPITGAWNLARRHDLNPWVFVAMSLLGYMVQAMVFLPWFDAQSMQLALLIALRVIALVVPAYILLKGRRIAAVFNISIVIMFVFNTAWHVCYYVYF